ncbi:hypothetical protein F4804DRAFT_336812 [Jackrogersella minutella]|nr:hypothetical protein F4804DRAFT_336812 [Jackrogersella minutella]
MIVRNDKGDEQCRRCYDLFAAPLRSPLSLAGYPPPPPSPCGYSSPPPRSSERNKTNSAVQLKHLPTGLVVKSQATRSRDQNRKIARQLLADKLDQMNNGDQSRESIVGRVKQKKKASSGKKSRRKYRKLEEEKQGKATGEEES